MKRLTHILIVLAVTLSAAARNDDPPQFTADQKLGMANYIIENFYVEPVNSDSIAQEAIIAMLNTLDPHSQYSTPAETKELTQPLDGKFSGIGIQFNMGTDTVYVIQPVAGGPSEKVGIRPGDRIIQADDSVLAGRKLPNSAVMKILRGDKGTKVRLKVKRAGVPDLIDFVVTRDDIPIHSVDDAYMASPEVGYIRLSRFAEESAQEVADAIDRLRKKGMKKLILDLESNGGGYLQAGVQVASLFLPKDAPVVSTRGRADAADFSALYNKPYFDGELAVLVDQTSASASEIVAGAVQDNDRGVILGRRTFGKGLVQRPFPLPDGSMIRLTVAKYYTPSGRCIQRPYEKGKGEEYYLDMLNRMKSGELFHADSIHFDESQKFQTLGKGRTVYGGGGIMPDVFVPVDTTDYSVYYRDIVAKGTLNQFVLGYIDTHRNELEKQYHTEDDFYDGFSVTPDIIDALVAKAESDSIKPNPEQLAISRKMIESVIKGLFARDLYENGSYSRAVNHLNPTFVKALEILATKEQ